MSAQTIDAREAYRTMTGPQYMAYLESLMGEPAAQQPERFKVQSAAELFTPEEIAEEEARCAAVLATDQARERIGNLHGEKAAHAFDAFRVVEASEFASGEDTEPDWQVRGVIPRQGTGLHPGPSGTLKSFAELDIAACINRGVPWHGRPVRKGRAVIICAEGARGYKRRLRAYARHHKVELAELPAIIPAAPNLFESAQISALIERLKLLGVTYCVLDTKFRCSVGSDENSASDQAVVLGSMDRIARELGCFCMAVTHTGHGDQTRARGSSSQYAAVDVELMQERDGEHCTVRCSKNKDGEDGHAFTFKAVKVDLGRNKHEEPESSLVLVPVDPVDAASAFQPKGVIEKAVYDYVRKSGETRFAREALIAGVIEATGKRADNVKRTIEKCALFMVDGDELVLRAPIVRDNAGWTEA